MSEVKLRRLYMQKLTISNKYLNDENFLKPKNNPKLKRKKPKKKRSTQEIVKIYVIDNSKKDTIPSWAKLAHVSSHPNNY
ncbi:MAG: hypothetical protein JSV20_04620 [Candidatus Bathyarchaeota archaeon]|nr:MAG: hypothetical protein JSV20_04620 [Candidatus Bathyarchaeota archaeon]